MPRPKKRAQRDEGQFVPYANHDNLVVDLHKEQTGIPDPERRTSIRNMRELYHRVGAGYRDPLSVAHVIDILQRWNPNNYIRAKYVSNALNIRQTALYYDTITVGKILAELTEIAAEAYKEHPKLQPLMDTMDYRGRLWLINSLPSSYSWFWKLRKGILAECSNVMAAEAEGMPPARLTSVWERTDTEAVW